MAGRKTKPDVYGESLLPVFLARHMRATDGNQAAFAERWGVVQQTTSRWASGQTQPAEADMDRFAGEMGVPSHALKALGTMGTRELVEVVDALSKKTPEAIEEAERAEAVSARFMEMVDERGELLPPAAYIIFLTGDTDGRESLLNVLDSHSDRIHVDTPTDTLQLIIDLSASQEPAS